MNVSGIGIDIIENKRISSNEIIDRILTEKEKEILKGIIDDSSKLNFVSGRFAAKEAIVKATNKKIQFHDIEILNDDSGKPIVFYRNKKIKDIMISISHETKFSVGMAIKLKDERIK